MYFEGPGMVQCGEASLLEAGVGQDRELRSDSGSLLMSAAKGRVALVGLALNAVHGKVV